MATQPSLDPHQYSITTHYPIQKSMSKNTPPFGTASAYADAFPAPPPKTLTLGAETCFNLSVFRG